MQLLTVGHGTLSQDDLVQLLRDAGVDRVVDVRRHPGSRRHPHVARDELATWLPAAGVGYRWEETLGGRRPVADDTPHRALRNASFRGYADHMDGPGFRDALATVLDESRRVRVTVMCSESVWWRCHRRLIADAASLLHAVDVRHLMHDGRLQPHPPTDGVRVAGDRLRYDAAPEPRLPLE